MSTWWRIVLSLWAAGWMAGCLSQQAASNRSPGERHLQDHLDRMRIAKLDAKHVTVRHVTQDLIAESLRQDPEHWGIAVAFPYPEDQDIPVTLNLNNVSLREAFGSLCQVTGLHYHLRDDAVVLSAHHDEVGPLTLRCFRLPAATLHRYLESPQASAPTPEALKELFERAGVPFPPLHGCGLEYDASTEMLTAANDAESLDIVGLVVDAMIRGSWAPN